LETAHKRAGGASTLPSGSREGLRIALAAGELEEELVEVEVSEPLANLQILGMPGGPSLDDMLGNLKEMFGGAESGLPKKKSQQKVPVKEARKLLTQDVQGQLVDRGDVVSQAIERVEQTGIVFIDEIDKIASRDTAHGPDVSRGGVQRDLLPIVEGSTVTTKHGMVRTDHILFIAAGAFSLYKPSDLIPELQGRFPIRVELQPLTREDLRRILVEPAGSLITQYRELMKTEGVRLELDDGAIDEIAVMAERVNAEAENIGARRLHTILEKLLEELSFSAPEITGQEVRITRQYVRDRLIGVVESQDLSRYIL
jgi:ATP-dependent HslUV protease ATP-binding subunit HslU